MGVMLSPGEDRMPTENELARIAGLVPGEVDQKKLLEVQQSLNEKGFMVTTAEDLFTWARTGSLIGAITALTRDGRRLVPFHPDEPNAVEAALAENEVLDPEASSEDYEPIARPGLLKGIRRRHR